MLGDSRRLVLRKVPDVDVGEVLELLELLETDDAGRVEFLRPFLNRERVVAQDAEIADAQEPISDFLELALLAEQEEGRLRRYQGGQPGSDRSARRQPVRPLDQSCINTFVPFPICTLVSTIGLF